MIHLHPFPTLHVLSRSSHNLTDNPEDIPEDSMLGLNTNALSAAFYCPWLTTKYAFECYSASDHSTVPLQSGSTGQWRHVDQGFKCYSCLIKH